MMKKSGSECSPKKEKQSKTYSLKKEKKTKRKHRSSSSSSSSSDDGLQDKTGTKSNFGVEKNERDDWMSMTGIIKTYTNKDFRPKKEEKSRNHIDSYNPATSSRELNPYWKDGGTGIPQTAESFRKSRQFIKPAADEDYYTRSSSSRDVDSSQTYKKLSYSTDSKKHDRHDTDKDLINNRYESRSHNWKKYTDSNKKENNQETENLLNVTKMKSHKTDQSQDENKIDSLYMSDEKLNKLAAKVVKAEIMGDSKLVKELKAKLDAAREYRKNNPNAGKEEEDERVMLIATNSMGNSRPLTNAAQGDPRSKGGKRKTETHSSGERVKYFGNDDKYDLKEMFQQEKYGNNYDEDAQLAKIASKHKNPNDDLEDIFMDDISKNRNAAKDNEVEKQRAIKQHVKIERSLEGCEYCVDSKNMLKHLMVTCGNKAYIAIPGRQSLVTGQCIITTIQHNMCVTALDEDVWAEILVYRKALTQFYNSQDKDVVFFETATKLHRYPHLVINCVPLPRDVGDMAAIYFKKALLECETEWSMNKKVVELRGRDIRKGVPKGLPYFWVDFGMEPGFAHVIEDQQLFPKSFGEEIIGGMLDLDHHLWKNPRKEFGDLQRKKVLDFIKQWKPFEPIMN